MLNPVVLSALKEFASNSQFEFLEYNPDNRNPHDLIVIDKNLSDIPSGWNNVISTSSTKPADLLKPIRISNLLSTIHSKLNIMDYGKPINISHNLSLIKSAGTLNGSNGQIIPLTDKEMALLVFIMENPDSTKDDILKHVWGFVADVETFTLETHTSSLRKKLEDASDELTTITVSGGRYSLCCK